MHISAFLAVAAPLAIRQTSTPYTGYAESAAKTLLGWYNTSSGIFDTTGWWNSANALTTLTDLAFADAHVEAEVIDVLSHSYITAQKYNLQMTKFYSSNGLIESFYAQRPPYFPPNEPLPPPVLPTGFLNGFYDDEGWWALAWLGAYDLTHNPMYLSTAQSIFEDMSKAWTTPCGGGIWWDRNHTQVNAIANELFLSVASHLANRVAPYQKSYYINWAHKELSWFKASGMINARGNIIDGLNLTTCKNNGQTVWTYNQGVILGGLTELNRAAPDASLLPMAQDIALAAITNLTDSKGVLHDRCEPQCGSDGSQFKGIYMRNLQQLNRAQPRKEYVELFKKNADNIWASDRDTANNRLSLVWDGPYIKPANASTQSSALDALVAAVGVA